MEPQTLVFFGIVGSGKGTQAKLLMEYLKAKDGKDTVYAYPGNEYRRLIESNSYTGQLIKESVAQGNLQPDFLTNAIVTNIVIDKLTANSHILFDGYPRTEEQSESLERKLKFFRRSEVKIIYIELSKEEAMKRNLKRGREDDTAEGLNKRFDEYINKVIPAMKYFESKQGYTLLTINGEQSIEDVHRDIIKALGY